MKKKEKKIKVAEAKFQGIGDPKKQTKRFS